MYKRIILPVFTLLSLSACAYDIESNKSVTSAAPEISASNLNIGLENAESLNTEALTLGVGCSAHTYKTNLGKDLEYSLTALDKDGDIGNSTKPDVKIVAVKSNNTVKCVILGAMSAKCQANVNASGNIVSKSGQSKPFKISKTSTMPNIVACEGATNSLRAASAETVAEIVTMVQKYDR